MRNISIDDVIEYMSIIYSDDYKEYELTDAEMSILLDTVRDLRDPNYLLNCFFASLNEPSIGSRINLSRSKEEEMSDICKLFDCKVKYQPERIPKLLKLKKSILYKIK
jgi:hypothetical protein